MQISKMRFLEEQLKFEKKQSKHSKQKAKFEKGRKNLLLFELHRLKDEFAKMLNHLDKLDSTLCHETMTDYTFRKTVCNVLSKSSDRRPSSVYESVMLAHELVTTSPSLRHPSDCLSPTVVHRALQKHSEPASGNGPATSAVLAEVLPVPLPESCRWSLGVQKRKHDDNIRVVVQNGFRGLSDQAPRRKKRKEILMKSSAL